MNEHANSSTHTDTYSDNFSTNAIHSHMMLYARIDAMNDNFRIYRGISSIARQHPLSETLRRTPNPIQRDNFQPPLQRSPPLLQIFRIIFTQQSCPSCGQFWQPLTLLFTLLYQLLSQLDKAREPFMSNNRRTLLRDDSEFKDHPPARLRADFGPASNANFAYEDVGG